MMKSKILGSYIIAAISWAKTIERMPIMYIGPFLSDLLK